MKLPKERETNPDSNEFNLFAQLAEIFLVSTDLVCESNLTRSLDSVNMFLLALILDVK